MHVFLIHKIPYHYIKKCLIYFLVKWFGSNKQKTTTTRRKHQTIYIHILRHTCIYFIMCTLYYNCKKCTNVICVWAGGLKHVNKNCKYTAFESTCINTQFDLKSPLHCQVTQYALCEKLGIVTFYTIRLHCSTV